MRRRRRVSKISNRNITPSHQVVLNCGEAGCGGGDPGVVFDYMEQNGLPEETCQNYEARDGDCQPNGVCEDCSYDGTGKSVCTAVTNFSKVRVPQLPAMCFCNTSPSGVWMATVSSTAAAIAMLPELWLAPSTR